MPIQKPVVITEYPKSGGSWIVSMLGDLLKVPKRDIYVNSDFNLFDIKKHPWYENAQDFDFPAESVIKSHELPQSHLINFDATYVNLIRDGRDVVISKWFFEKDFYVKNNIVPSFDKQFDDYVIETANEWSDYVTAWADHASFTIRYEDFLTDTVASLRKLLNSITEETYIEEDIQDTVARFSRKNFSASFDKVFKYNSFVRKGISGDWRNYFSRKNIDSFKAIAGNTLVTLGYEKSMDWKT